MTTVVHDLQSVPESGSYSGKELMWEAIQQGTTNSLVTIKNAGANTIDYVFQEYTGSAWADLGLSGTDYNNSLAAAASLSLKLISSYPKVRLLGKASGGSTLEFTVVRNVVRASSGQLPLLSF